MEGTALPAAPVDRDLTAIHREPPRMNAFEAAEKAGRKEALQKELEELFASQNTTGRADQTSIPAAFLRVTVAR
jgi:hypothetical protein